MLAPFALQISVLSFYKTGHHYRSNQDETIEKIFHSCTLDEYKLTYLNEHMMRTATHCFGVWPLHEYMYLNLTKKGVAAMVKMNVPAPIALRFEGLPAG